MIRMMLRRLTVPLFLAIALTGCSVRVGKFEEKLYSMEGTVKALDANAKSATPPMPLRRMAEVERNAVKCRCIQE